MLFHAAEKIMDLFGHTKRLPSLTRLLGTRVIYTSRGTTHINEFNHSLFTCNVRDPLKGKLSKLQGEFVIIFRLTCTNRQLSTVPIMSTTPFLRQHMNLLVILGIWTLTVKQANNQLGPLLFFASFVLTVLKENRRQTTR